MENQYLLRDNVVMISIKVLLGLCVLGYMSTLLGTTEEKQLNPENPEQGPHSPAIVENDSDIVEPIIPIKKVILQPHCEPSSKEIALRLLLLEIYRCQPDDIKREKLKAAPPPRKFKRNRHKSKAENTESMVVYVAVGLLLISLGAALLEVFKFSNQPATIKTKPTLNRSCSLADLTVMRHNRKELMRRDSMLEGSSLEARGAAKLDRQTSSQYRRCSFPVGPTDPRRNNNFGPIEPYSHTSRPFSRKTSIDADGGSFFPMQQHRHSHIRLLHRH
ncbi:hypothetical protein Trydic_g4955 [Trypoxylus dichotomus]